MTRLALAFFGSAAFSVPTLAALFEAGHDVPARLRFRGEKQDFEEMLGNLLDNALTMPVILPSRLHQNILHSAFSAALLSLQSR